MKQNPELSRSADTDQPTPVKIPCSMPISALIVGTVLTIFFPPALLISLGFYYLGHVLWLPWPFLVYADYKTSRTGRYHPLLRYLNAACAAAVAAFLAYQLQMMDVWDEDPDFRGGIVFGWLMNITALFAVYVTLRFSARFSLPRGFRPPRSKFEIDPPLVYLAIYAILITSALYITTINWSQDAGMESLLVAFSGLAALIALLNGRDVCSRAPSSLIANSLLFLGSLAGLGICLCSAGFSWFAPLSWARHSVKPWYILAASSVFTGATLLFALTRRPQ